MDSYLHHRYSSHNCMLLGAALYACHCVTPKSVRSDQFWQKFLPKLVPRTTFAAKIGPAGLILAAKTVPLYQFWSPVKCKFATIKPSLASYSCRVLGYSYSYK